MVSNKACSGTLPGKQGLTLGMLFDKEKKLICIFTLYVKHELCQCSLVVETGFRQLDISLILNPSGQCFQCMSSECLMGALIRSAFYR